MGIVQIHKNEPDSPEQANTAPTDNPDWIKYAAGGALITGGLLLLTGQRRAGLVVGAAGAGLALVDQQENVRSIWNQVPGYVDKFQSLVNQVQEKVDSFSSKRDSLHRVLSSFGRGA